MGLSSSPRALYLLRAIALYLQAVSLVTLLSPLPHPGLYLPDLVVFALAVMVDCADSVFLSLEDQISHLVSRSAQSSEYTAGSKYKPQTENR